MAATDCQFPGALLARRQIDFLPDDFVWRRLPSPLSLLHDFSLDRFRSRL